MEILPNFAVFEGGDGSGTSTQISLLKAKFDAGGPDLPVLHTDFEPTPGPIGRLIRSALKKELILEAETLARLFAADRGEHLYAPRGIMERCKRGELVVCDRYTPSSLVYQGIECGSELPHTLNSAFPAPELLFFFDIDPQKALDRLQTRDSLEIYEHLDFQRKVRERYLLLLDEYRGAGVRVELIDAAQDPRKIADQIWTALAKMPIFNTRTSCETI